MEDYKARWLVRDWHEASAEARADPRAYGPLTREITREAFATLGLPVPDALARTPIPSTGENDG